MKIKSKNVKGKEQYTGLVRKRGSVKQRLTLFQKYLSDLIGVSSQENYEIEEESVYELEQRLSSAISLLSEYEDFQIQIELLVSDTEIDIQYQDRAQFQSNYYTWTSKGQKLLKTFQAKFQIDDRNSVHSGNSRLNELIDRTDKYGKARELKLCLNCLKGGHFVQKSRQKSLSKSSSQAALSSFAPSSAMVLLSTVSLQVFDTFGKPHTVKAILDSVSQSSYISSNLANLLQLKRTHLDFKVVGLNLVTTKIEGRCQVKVQSHHTGFNTVISCLVIPEITGKLPEFSFDISELAIPKLIRLADPSLKICSKIDMLLGAACFWDLLCAAQIKLGVNKHVLQKTKFGWVVSGPINTCYESRLTHCKFSLGDLYQQISRFWEIEDGSLEGCNLSMQEQMCGNHFAKTIVQQEDGRFVASKIV
ncbi:hypothetical protein NQ318_007726 [Aromia moschata]|uniref:Peptidase aspartic putative domain-containing protein n=1 Tax=Aromia moschata TaxID=1265417 RepID=A0AAV8Z1S0_9CUCU|nr:hypothetical protein NQ318_007726 [Aromia moschata]